MTSLSRDPVRTADIARRRTLRKELGCSHWPACADAVAHLARCADDAALKERAIAERIAYTQSVVELMRFTVRECADPRVIAMTSARRIFFVAEKGDEHGHAVFVDRETDRHTCVMHPDGCLSVRAVLNHEMSTLLGEPSNGESGG